MAATRAFILALEGIDELRKALRDLPEHLQNEARIIVEQAAQDTAREVLGVYPGRGPLRRGVYVVDKSSPLQERWRVESRSHEAEWWEFGTENRVTQRGWNRGSAPAHKDTGLISIAKRHRRSMLAALIALVRGEGFAVQETV